MTYYYDFKEIIEANYINAKQLDCLSSLQIPERIKNLNTDLNAMLQRDKIFIENFLKVMTELAIYKNTLDIKMKVNKLKDPKDSSKKYIQVRGSVRISKNKRIWVGVYIGTEAEVCDTNGNVFPEKFCQGREEVIKKIVERFKDLQLG